MGLVESGLSSGLLACAAGHVEIVARLMDAGADTEAVDQDDKTALMVASEAGLVKIVRLLVDRGTRLTTLDAKGWSALTYAESNHHPGLNTPQRTIAAWGKE